MTSQPPSPTPPALLGRALAACALIAAGACAPAPSDTTAESPTLSRATAYVGGSLVDGTGAPPVDDAVLVVRDGRIECAGAADLCPVPEDAEAIDVAGRWLTPGLVDAHVHFAQTAWADGRPDGMNVTDRYPYPEVVHGQFGRAATTYRSYLCSGITAVFDVGGFPWSWQLRDDELEGVRIPQGGETSLPPPHVAAAGPLLTWVAPRMSLPAEQVMVQVTDPERAREVVEYLAAADSDAVKIWFLGVRPDGNRPSPEEVDAWVTAAGEEAAARGLPLIVHATSLREAKVAVRAGAHLLVHSVEDQPVDDEFLALAAEQGTIYTPTLIVGENWWRMSESAFTGSAPTLDDPNSCIDPASRTRILSTPDYREHPGIARLDDDAVAARNESIEQRKTLMGENLYRAWDAGVTVTVGTDAGNPFTTHGPSIYAEMERMQAAGIPAEEIVVMATRNGARAMGRESEFGTLEPGKSADFLVLSGDPTVDVAAFRTVSHVARAGALLPVAELSFPPER